MLLKTWFLLLYFFSNVELELINIIHLVLQHQKVARYFKLNKKR